MAGPTRWCTISRSCRVRGRISRCPVARRSTSDGRILPRPESGAAGVGRWPGRRAGARSRARVVCVGASAAAQLLADRRLTAESYPDLNQALQALVDGRADALVHDRALLAAVLKERPDLRVRILPGTVRQEYYAFAMRPDEPLRRPINLAIAHILDSEE